MLRSYGPAQVSAIIGDEPLDRQIDLTDEDALGELVDDGAQLPHYLVDIRMVGRMHLQQTLDLGLATP